MKSLLQTEKECYICKTTLNLHKHHLYFGNYAREKSEKYGLYCYLCVNHHTGNNGVHNNPKLDKRLKQIGQELFEEYNKPNGHQLFMSIFKKSYLDGGENQIWKD